MKTGRGVWAHREGYPGGMLTLHTTPVSANGRKPLAVGRHLGLDLDVRTVDVYRGEGQAPGYRALNPWGKVPTLVDGDFVLWESNAILVYLSEAHGGFALSSHEPGERANILRWMFWEASHWQPTLTRVLAPRAAQVLFPAAGAEVARVAWEDKELETLLGFLDATLQAGPFLCGKALTLADFSVAGMTTYFRVTGFPGERYPAVAAWTRRLDELPAWASTLVDPWRGGSEAS